MEHQSSKLTTSPSSASSQLQWRPRNNITVFIHALHLLDLDLLPHWPNISELTFSSSKSAQNLHTRVKSTEWALYHLFRLYSHLETASRLSPHFPPTTPIQSKNLRAGLYKWLAELKSTGVLPRELLLRKTMLDECKGNRYEEVLARFAMVVLRKELAREGKHRNKTSISIAEEQDPEVLEPLVLAQRTSLQQCFKRRQELKGKATEFSEDLARLRSDVENNLPEEDFHSASSDSVGVPLSAEELDKIRGQVDLAFSNDRRWAKFIFEGTSGMPLEASKWEMPKWPFDNDNAAESESIESENAQNEIDEPMRQLQDMVSRHSERLHQLMQLRDSLLPKVSQTEVNLIDGNLAESAGPSTFHRDTGSNNSKPRFSRHQELILRL